MITAVAVVERLDHLVAVDPAVREPAERVVDLANEVPGASAGRNARHGAERSRFVPTREVAVRSGIRDVLWRQQGNWASRMVIDEGERSVASATMAVALGSGARRARARCGHRACGGGIDKRSADGGAREVDLKRHLAPGPGGVAAVGRDGVDVGREALSSLARLGRYRGRRDRLYVCPIPAGRGA